MVSSFLQVNQANTHRSFWPMRPQPDPFLSMRCHGFEIIKTVSRYKCLLGCYERWLNRQSNTATLLLSLAETASVDGLAAHELGIPRSHFGG